jgi:hypothetical protein
MADGDEAKIAGRHVAELGNFFNAHDQWLFGHACVRANGDRELAADLVQDTFEATPSSASTSRSGTPPVMTPSRRGPSSYSGSPGTWTRPTRSGSAGKRARRAARTVFEKFTDRARLAVVKS